MPCPSSQETQLVLGRLCRQDLAFLPCTTPSCDKSPKNLSPFSNKSSATQVPAGHQVTDRQRHIRCPMGAD